MITFNKDSRYKHQGQKGFSQLIESARKNAPFTGWVDLPRETQWASEAKAWAKQNKGFSKLVVLGIGGSSLGAKAVLEALGLSDNVRFFENVDGHAFYSEISKFDLSKTHFVAISKSGNTLETLCQVGAVFDLLRGKNLEPNTHFTVISENKKSPLTEIARQYDIPTFAVPESVGGRFSVLSNVGLFPIAWAGANVDELLHGSQWARNQEEMIAQMAGTFLESFERNEWITVFWIYVERLRSWGLWLEQLWAESLAKKVNRTGKTAPRVSTPISAVGATDQHSLLQQFMEGASDKFFLFIRCQGSEKSKTIPSGISPALKLLEGKSLGQLLSIEARATQEALTKNGKQTANLMIERLDAFNVGALLYLFEAVVGVLGECLDINAFDQPGVELGKRIMLAELGDLR